ncbi:hypothetical protein [Dictyobacter kobayashii]|uniref:Uncharacterized protein n=1 Tax=Dictyobacter kobayashii TaxID=2014872 RepID=A0A402AIZ8_9CHLR|nr:hypothetical protein [Dictyobacter kobayashii]GCE19069.1 hypothetical protein KDK_28690 [Dictyobacter kobayashii]
MAQHIRPTTRSDFSKGILMGRQAVDQTTVQDVRENPWNFTEGVFDTYDPSFTEELRAGYVVGYLSEVFGLSQQENPGAFTAHQGL